MGKYTLITSIKQIWDSFEGNELVIFKYQVKENDPTITYKYGRKFKLLSTGQQGLNWSHVGKFHSYLCVLKQWRCLNLYHLVHLKLGSNIPVKVKRDFLC